MEERPPRRARVYVCFLFLGNISWYGELSQGTRRTGAGLPVTFVRYSLWRVCNRLDYGNGHYTESLLNKLRMVCSVWLINICLSSVSWSTSIAGLESNLPVLSFIKIVLRPLPYISRMNHSAFLQHHRFMSWESLLGEFLKWATASGWHTSILQEWWNCNWYFFFSALRACHFTSYLFFSSFLEVPQDSLVSKNIIRMHSGQCWKIKFSYVMLVKKRGV